jgi:uncharacterized protein
VIIDMHIHLADYKIYPGYWLEGIKKDIARSLKKENGLDVPDALLSNIVQNSLQDFDCSKLIAQMDNAGIDKSVILLADLGYESNDATLSIEELFSIHHEALARYPERLIVFGGMDPRRGKEGAALFEKGIKEYGFRGLKIYPPCGFELNDRKLYPLYEICAHYHLPVLTHTGPSLSSMKSIFNYPASVLEVAREFKNLPIILGHAAILYYEESCKLPLERKNIYLEMSGFQQHFDDREHLISKIESLFQICPENILFGTDWPLFNTKGSQKKWVNFFQELDILTETQRELLFYKNAMTILLMQDRESVQPQIPGSALN